MVKHKHDKTQAPKRFKNSTLIDNSTLLNSGANVQPNRLSQRNYSLIAMLVIIVMAAHGAV